MCLLRNSCDHSMHLVGASWYSPQSFVKIARYKRCLLEDHPPHKLSSLAGPFVAQEEPVFLPQCYGELKLFYNLSRTHNCRYCGAENFTDTRFTCWLIGGRDKRGLGRPWDRGLAVVCRTCSPLCLHGNTCREPEVQLSALIDFRVVWEVACNPGTRQIPSRHLELVPKSRISHFFHPRSAFVHQYDTKNA